MEFRCLQQGGVYSGMCSEQQGGVPLSPTGWGFQWCEQQGGVPLSPTGWGFQWCELQGGVPLSMYLFIY